MISSLVLIAALAASPEPKAPLEVMPKARGFTLETSLVGGAAVLRPGDHIDVVAVMMDPEAKRLISVTLLQNVIVMANAAPATGEARQLSLLLIPEEAELLAFAKHAGHLTATLRNATDVEVLDTPGMATMSMVMTGERTPFPKKKK